MIAHSSEGGAGAIAPALTPARAAALKPLLDAFVESRPWSDRVRADPVEFPHRYDDPRDVEVVALISASLAYGRADLFKPKLAWLFERLGAHPAKAVRSLDVRGAKSLLRGFVYRFNVPADLAVLLLGVGRTLEAKGSLEAHFLSALASAGTWQGALAGFASGVRAAAPEKEIVRQLGPTRGLSHLLPSAAAGAAKRLNLYLRWMVRGPDEIDFGIWKRVSASRLVMPLDTHVMRIGRWLGLTTRNTISWRTAEELTASLRLLDPVDPVRYDFAICHYGMSGACPTRPVKENCRKCPLRGVC
ncbi:MAG: TIGR02757 family protein, partial [Myxococcota bacterium]